MRDQELVNAIRRLKVETGSLACMGCGHEHNCGVSGCAVMREAADRIANQSTHILALQKEIAGLRKAVRWVHDGLYLCDPEKNTVCKKSSCKTLCFHTTFPEFADALAETPAPHQVDPGDGAAAGITELGRINSGAWIDKKRKRTFLE